MSAESLSGVDEAAVLVTVHTAQVTQDRHASAQQSATQSASDTPRVECTQAARAVTPLMDEATATLGTDTQPHDAVTDDDDVAHGEANTPAAAVDAATTTTTTMATTDAVVMMCDDAPVHSESVDQRKRSRDDTVTSPLPPQQHDKCDTNNDDDDDDSTRCTQREVVRVTCDAATCVRDEPPCEAAAAMADVCDTTHKASDAAVGVAVVDVAATTVTNNDDDDGGDNKGSDTHKTATTCSSAVVDVGGDDAMHTRDTLLCDGACASDTAAQPSATTPCDAA